MNDFQSRFDELRQQFLARSGERIDALRQLIEALPGRPSDEGLLKDIRQHFHWLAGSGGIYGFGGVTRYGLSGEELCDFLLKENVPTSKGEAEKMMQLVGLIKTAIAGQEAQPHQAATPVPEPSHLPRDRPYALFVESNPISVHGFLRHLEEQNIHVETIRSVNAARSMIMRRLPDIMVISLPVEDGNAYELPALVRSMPGGERPPILVITEAGGFLDKVEAIRSGVDAYFEHPLDDGEISRKIRHLLDRDKPERYRVMSVEDDPDQAEFIKLTLESAGYNVLSLQDATKFEEVFLQFDPDLVLLDVMLGPMTGFEIAQYIRQQDRYAALPVVFLTTENALEMHIRSARIGGDDHLIKPIAPQLLAAAVAGRLEKGRVLKKLIERDILTGCLNHSAFMERARQSMEPDSHRYSLTLLVFDVDNLRIINQRFGFAAGDKVLASAGPLLLRAFRNCPLVGRISGNRFALILENLDEYQVERLAHQVIIDFGAVQHHAGGGTFRATISGAFSEMREDEELSAWLDEASALLARAKEQGGNQIVSPNSVPEWARQRK